MGMVIMVFGGYSVCCYLDPYRLANRLKPVAGTALLEPAILRSQKYWNQLLLSSICRPGLGYRVESPYGCSTEQDVLASCSKQRTLQETRLQGFSGRAQRPPGALRARSAS